MGYGELLYDFISLLFKKLLLKGSIRIGIWSYLLLRTLLLFMITIIVPRVCFFPIFRYKQTSRQYNFIFFNVKLMLHLVEWKLIRRICKILKNRLTYMPIIHHILYSTPDSQTNPLIPHTWFCFARLCMIWMHMEKMIPF